MKKRREGKKILASVLLASIPIALDDRDNPFFREQLNWTEHVAALNNEGANAFFWMYRMHYPSLHETLFSD